MTACASTILENRARPDSAESPFGGVNVMVGPEVVARYRVINHSAYDKATMAEARPAQDGVPALWMNREYVAADRRILIGFIEPHFMAGYSGGYLSLIHI